jgi:hypothetical protein
MQDVGFTKFYFEIKKKKKKQSYGAGLQFKLMLNRQKVTRVLATILHF